MNSDSSCGVPVVTIDGPSGAGKGTLAAAIAEAEDLGGGDEAGKLVSEALHPKCPVADGLRCRRESIRTNSLRRHRPRVEQERLG